MKKTVIEDLPRVRPITLMTFLVYRKSAVIVPSVICDIENFYNSHRFFQSSFLYNICTNVEECRFTYIQHCLFCCITEIGTVLVWFSSIIIINFNWNVTSTKNLYFNFPGFATQIFYFSKEQ